MSMVALCDGLMTLLEDAYFLQLEVQFEPNQRFKPWIVREQLLY
jgi:hypothetical protein